MHLVRIVRSHLLASMTILVLAVGVATAVALTSPKKFTATATVQIDPPKQSPLQSGVNAVLDNDPTTSLIETEVGELQSFTLAESVAQQLHLEGVAEFNGALRPPTLISRLLHRPAAPKETRVTKAIVEALLGHIKVNHSGTSYLLTFSATSLSPNLAAEIANAFVQRFISSQRGARVSAVMAGGSRISERLDELRMEVEEADTKLQQYKIANGLMSAQGATLTEQEISGLDQQLADARAREAEARAKLTTARAQMAQGSTGGDVGEALSSPVIQQLRQRRAEISQTLAGLQSRYTPAHPKVIKAQTELADTDAQIQAEIGRIISNLDAQARVAHQREASIEGSVGQSRGSLAQNNRAMVKLNELQRNADAAKALYDTFLTRYKETDAEAGFQNSDVQVVDAATAPTSPSEPKKGLIIVFGALAGLSLAFGYMLVAEQVFHGLNGAEAVVAELKRNYLGSIPLMSSTLEKTESKRENPIDYVVDKPMSSFAEAYRGVLAAVTFSNLNRAPQVVAITSSLPNEGKTTTSICLARMAALSGVNTLLVDCDLRRRSVNRAMGIRPETGLVEVLDGDADLDQALIRDSKTNLTILPLRGGDGVSPVELFMQPAMDELMAELRKRFQLVVLDTGPVILVTNTRHLVRHTDYVLVLARWRKTPRRVARTALRLLEDAGATSGVALNLVDLRLTTRVDPADPSSYYRTYREYYQAG